jgi:hypothetical protein
LPFEPYVANSAREWLPGKRIRKDAIWGIEVVFTGHPKNGTDFVTFYEACTTWAESRFGIEALSSTIHFDQGSPHCHVILLPLINGRMQGGKLHGNRGQLIERIDNFYSECCGLICPDTSIGGKST